MHKDQYTDAPSQEQVRVKTMLNSTISMGYPDVVIACIEWICPYISRHLLSLNPLLACCRRYSRG
ncbi:hypothetical protein EXX22_12910, partial [Escherichia coli]